LYTCTACSSQSKEQLFIYTVETVKSDPGRLMLVHQRLLGAVAVQLSLPHLDQVVSRYNHHPYLGPAICMPITLATTHIKTDKRTNT